MSWTPSEMGKKGGAVKGASKVRGTSEYYKAIRAKRTEKLKAGALHYSKRIMPLSEISSVDIPTDIAKVINDNFNQLT